MYIILNILIDALVLWAGRELSPEFVQIDSISTLIIAAILITVIRGACVLFLSFGLGFESFSWVIIGLFAVLFSAYIALVVLSNYLDGFMVVGFWPKVLLSLCLLVAEVLSED